MSEKYYDINLVGAALHFAEILGELFDSEPNQPNDEEFDQMVFDALAKVGYKNIDQDKLNRSMHFYMTESGEDVYSCDGYSVEYPFDDEEG